MFLVVGTLSLTDYKKKVNGELQARGCDIFVFLFEDPELTSSSSPLLEREREKKNFPKTGTSSVRDLPSATLIASSPGYPLSPPARRAAHPRMRVGRRTRHDTYGTLPPCQRSREKIWREQATAQGLWGEGCSRRAWDWFPSPFTPTQEPDAPK